MIFFEKSQDMLSYITKYKSSIGKNLVFCIKFTPYGLTIIKFNYYIYRH